MIVGLHKDDGGPAFPGARETNGNGDVLWHGSLGMTLRDWFAGQAMAALICGGAAGLPPDEVAKWAYETADAMIAHKRGTERNG